MFGFPPGDAADRGIGQSDGALAAASDRPPRRATAAPALFGASFAVVAALAGAFAHGAAAPEAFRSAPSFNALFLLTALVLLAGALSGIAADRLHAVAARVAAGGGRTRRVVAAVGTATAPRILGLLGPALAGQYLAHSILSADSAIAGALSAPGSGTLAGGDPATGGTPGAATSALLAEHAGHVGSVGPVSHAAVLGHAGMTHEHASMILPMLGAHALGVIACLALCALADRALRSLCDRILRPVVATAAPASAAPIPDRSAVFSTRATIIGAGPRAPPFLLALAA